MLDQCQEKYNHLKNLSIAINAIASICIAEFKEILYFYKDDIPTQDIPARKNRKIDDWSEDDCLTFFRFSKDELRQLLVYWRVPETLVFLTSRHVCTGEEAMLLYLHFLAHGNTYRIMQETFGDDGPRRYGPMIHAFVHHLYTNFYHKISGNSLNIFLHLMDDFWRAIWRTLVTNQVLEEHYVLGVVMEAVIIFIRLTFESFRVFGFLDGSAFVFCSPESETIYFS